jgi:hypothetical protein
LSVNTFEGSAFVDSFGENGNDSICSIRLHFKSNLEGCR